MQPSGSHATPPASHVLMVLDVVGSVGLMEDDERGFILRWDRFVADVREQVLPRHGGRILKSLGDGLMIEFLDASEAVRAGQALLRQVARENESLPRERQLKLRIAAHVAEYVANGFDVYGRGVNLTARLLGLPRPDEMFITAALREQLDEDSLRATHKVGTCELRGVVRPVRIYRVVTPGVTPQHDTPAPVPPAAAFADSSIGAESGFGDSSLGPDSQGFTDSALPEPVPGQDVTSAPGACASE